MPRRSIGGPLAIGIVSMVLVLALGVGWQILVWRDDADAAPGMSTFDMVLFGFGTLFFLMVFAGLIWLCVKLVLEMRLSQSQRAFIDAVTHELKTRSLHSASGSRPSTDMSSRRRNGPSFSVGWGGPRPARTP